MRRVPRRSAALILTAALTATLTAACGVRPSGVIAAGDPAVAEQPPPQTTVYLVRGGKLVPVRRVDFPGAPESALDTLAMEGVTPEERADGLSDPIQKLADFRVWREGDLLIVNVAPMRLVSTLLTAQIVCSGTAQPGIEAVILIIDEGSVGKLHPLTCKPYHRLISR